MRQYETTFIVDPILSGDEIRQTAQMYVDFLKAGECEVIHLEETGALQLAYPIKKRTTGAYFWLEYHAPIGSDVIEKMELAFRRDDNVLRYLTIKVDKHRAQFNIDKRAGKFDKKAAVEENGTETPTTEKAAEVSAKSKVEG
jgi:small subunit ribosomal protein S6